MGRRFRSPTVETLALIAAVSVVGFLSDLLGAPGVLALSEPVLARPWALVTSVYAHAGLAHVLANLLALAVFGFAVERVTTRARYHLFFLVTGVLAGLAEVLVGGLFGRSIAVLGASGAIFALFGYLLTGNAVAGSLLDRFDGRVRVGLIVSVAVVVTIVSAGPGVALVAHFTGFVLGVLAGRVRLLHV